MHLLPLCVLPLIDDEPFHRHMISGILHNHFWSLHDNSSGLSVGGEWCKCNLLSEMAEKNSGGFFSSFQCHADCGPILNRTVMSLILQWF